MTEEQYYGGSTQEAQDGRESARVHEKMIKYGFAIRREKSKIVIILNTSEDEKDEQQR